MPVGDQTVAAVSEAALAALQPASAYRGDTGHDEAVAAANRARAVALKLSGLPYEQVAVLAGYANKSAARQAVLRALDRWEESSVAELRQTENARLDRAQAAIWEKVVSGDLQAVDTLVRLSARRARMNGLDAPQQVSITSGAQAALHDALADLRHVVLGEVVDDGLPGQG